MAKDLVVKVGADIGDFEKKMAGISGKMKDLGDKMQDVGKKMSMYVTLPIIAMGAAVAKTAMDLEASNAKFNTVFRGMTDEAMGFIKEFKKLTPATTAEARNMASGIQDLLVPMGFARDKATELTGEFLHIAGALTNFNSGTHNAQEVMVALNAAIVGEYEGLRRLGVQLDTTTIKEKAVEMGLADTTQEVTKQHQAQVLLKEIYAQSSDALAGYTKENLDAKTSMGLLRADLVDMGETFGRILLPYLIKIIAKAREWVEWFKGLDEGTKKIILVVGGLVAAIGPLLIGLGFLMSTIIPALIAGGAMIAASWAPITLIILGVAAAFALFGKEVKASQKEVNKLLETNSIDELKRQADELNNLIIKLRSERNKPKKDREVIETEEGVGYRMDNETLDELIKKELQRLVNLEAAIKFKKTADQEALDMAAKYALEQAAIEEELKKQNLATEKKLALLAELERLKKLDEQRAELKEISFDFTGALEDATAEIERLAKQGRAIMKVPIELDVSEPDVDAAIESVKNRFIDFSNEISALLTSSITTIFEGLGAGMTGAEIGKDFLLNLAKFGQRVGGILIAVGFAVEAFKLSLETLNGVGLIVAGGVLLAASSLAVGALRGGMSGSGSGGGYGSTQSGGTIEGMRDWSQLRVIVSGELRGDGSELKAVIDSENIRQGL